MKNKKAILGIVAALVVVAVVALGANTELFQGRVALQTGEGAPSSTILKVKKSVIFTVAEEGVSLPGITDVNLLNENLFTTVIIKDVINEPFYLGDGEYAFSSQ